MKKKEKTKTNQKDVCGHKVMWCLSNTFPGSNPD